MTLVEVLTSRETEAVVTPLTAFFAFDVAVLSSFVVVLEASDRESS